MSRNSRQIAESITSIIEETIEEGLDTAVETALENYDWDGILPNFDDKVKEAVDDTNLDSLVTDAVQEEFANIDFDQKVETAVEDNIELVVHNYLDKNIDLEEFAEKQFKLYLNSPEFDNKLKAILKEFALNILYSPIHYTKNLASYLKKMYKSFTFEMYVVWIEFLHFCKKK